MPREAPKIFQQKGYNQKPNQFSFLTDDASIHIMKTDFWENWHTKNKELFKLKYNGKKRNKHNANTQRKEERKNQFQCVICMRKRISFRNTENVKAFVNFYHWLSRFICVIVYIFPSHLTTVLHNLARQAYISIEFKRICRVCVCVCPCRFPIVMQSLYLLLYNFTADTGTYFNYTNIINNDFRWMN